MEGTLSAVAHDRVGRGQDEAGRPDLASPFEQGLGDDDIVGERTSWVFDRPQHLSLGCHVDYGPGAGRQRFFDDGAVAQVADHDTDVVVPLGVAPERPAQAGGPPTRHRLPTCTEQPLRERR